MGSLLSLVTPEAVVIAVVTTTCGTLVYRFVLHPDVASSSAQLAPSSSPRRPPAAKVTGAKPKKKKRAAQNQRQMNAGDVEAPTAGAEPSHGAGARHGNGLILRPEAKRVPPAVVPFSQAIPGDIEARTETRADTSAYVGHSSQALDAPTAAAAAAKKGRKKRAKADTDSGSSAVPGHQDIRGVSKGQPGQGEFDVFSGSSISKKASVTSEPEPKPKSSPSQPQPKPLRQDKQRLQSSPSFGDDGSWIRVESRRLDCPPSPDGKADANVVSVSTDLTSSDAGASSAGGDSFTVENADEEDADPAGSNGPNTRRTLAEKLAPRPRRTGVEDMLQRPDVPPPARVMRVAPRADELPAPGFSWGDYEDVAAGNHTANDADGEDEGGWGIVKGKARPRNQRASPPEQPSEAAPERTLTKKQRQNAKKREMAKAAKAETEATRLEGLAKHKRGGKLASGGMQATVDNRVAATNDSMVDIM
ncbi:hypothetical protein ID866_4996 [Astraeus odoratus]|nr:hypothetical protein ID866_4996 [Astraeus odoratus]